MVEKSFVVPLGNSSRDRYRLYCITQRGQVTLFQVQYEAFIDGKMNELFAVKYDELLTEFNYYVMTHPHFLAKIPDEAVIVLIDPKDPEFNRYNLKRFQDYQQNDDKSDRPVVYVNVGELAPLQSRLIKPRILSRLPKTLWAASS